MPNIYVKGHLVQKLLSGHIRLIALPEQLKSILLPLLLFIPAV